MSVALHNIISYVKDYGDYTFSNKKLNEVDSLVLSQITYLNFMEFVGSANSKDGTEPKAVYLKEIYDSNDYENLFKNYWYYDENKELVENMVNSKRFGDLKINYFESVYDEEKDVQFAAVTYILGDNSYYLAYRGTDATIIGWKEDLKMAYSKPVYAQTLALKYMIKVSERIPGSFYVGGHSKGGNLAVYASMMCEAEIRDRILDIFSHDGPGFRPEILENSNIEFIRDRLHKYIPAESIVGIIMNEDDDYDIIDCYKKGTFQHNTYTWKCSMGKLIRLESMSKRKMLADKALNQWIYSLSENETDEFIDTLYLLTSVNDAKSIFDFLENPKEMFEEMKKIYKAMDDTKKDIFEGLFTRFWDISMELAKIEYTEKGQEFVDNMKDNLKEIQSYLSTLLNSSK